MEITHEEARRLIQQNTDKVLPQTKQIMLRAHLDDCADCRTYAGEFIEIENALRRVMHRQWELHPLPLSMSVITSRRKFRRRVYNFLTTRTAIVSIALLAIIFGIWQFKLINSGTSGQVPLHILPVPTPSTQLTSTRIGVQTCKEISYVVQENDTLDSLAERFFTSKESIMTANTLKTEALTRGIEIIIPLCDSTPRSTMNPPTGTLHTPSTNPTTNTPNGSTQS